MIKTIAIALVLNSGLTAIENVNHFMPYMDYNCITNTSSIQYQMQQSATTDEKGFRKYNDNYMVALDANNYQVGDNLILKIDENSYNVVVGDVRATNDTSDVIEFIVDVNKISTETKQSGNCLSCFIDCENY